MNWIRLNSPPIDSARVLIAIVLARPGTPSTRRWPRARSATEHPLEEVVLADDDLLHLVEQRAPSAARVGGRRGVHGRCSFGVDRHGGGSRSAQYGRQAGGAAGDVDRDGQADPDEDIMLGRVDEARSRSRRRGRRGRERTAGVAGVDGGVDLDQAVETAAVSGAGTSGRGRTRRPR